MKLINFLASLFLLITFTSAQEIKVSPFVGYGVRGYAGVMGQYSKLSFGFGWAGVTLEKNSISYSVAINKKIKDTKWTTFAGVSLRTNANYGYYDNEYVNAYQFGFGGSRLITNSIYVNLGMWAGASSLNVGVAPELTILYSFNL